MMRCFLPCFGSCRRRNQLRSSNAIPTEGGKTHVGEGAIEPLARQKTVVEELIDCIAESNAETKEELSREEEAPPIDGHEQDHEINKRSHQEESSESLFSLSVCSRKQVSDAEHEVNSPMQLVCAREVPQGKPSKHHKKEEESSAKELMKKLDENKRDPVPEYRYRDCPDDLDANRSWVQEESSESLFSLSTDSRIPISSAEPENEVDSLLPAHATNRITQADVSSVLNPIENLLTQGRVVKATVLQPLKNDKENINLDVDNIPISSEPSLKLSNGKARLRFNEKKQEIGVDTSLSSWLVESETTPMSINSTSSVGEHTPKGRGSPWSHEDRPILGALTVEEIRMFSISASSRRSRSRSPDETPIIGTVGSYWSRTEQSMDLEFNKSELLVLQDVKPKRSSTALQTRLERAFEASVSEV